MKKGELWKDRKEERNIRKKIRKRNEKLFGVCEKNWEKMRYGGK